MAKWSARRFLVAGVAAMALVLALAQVLPFGHTRTNPPVTGEPPWDSSRTRDLFDRACGDCHSNATRWPWYASVAPMSWLVVHDVEEGRSKFNVSEWGRPRRNEGEEAAGELRKGAMPLRAYRLAHPEARLSPEDRDALIAGLAATFGGEHEGEERD